MRWRRLQPAVASPWPAAPQYYLPRTGSTMEDARALIRQAPVHGALIVTNYQTRGRGRTPRRHWVSAPGRNLLFNLLLARSAVSAPVSGPDAGGGAGTPARLPLLCGLAVARAVEAVSGVACRVKWPNDVIVRGSKVAGCLCEALAGWCSVGVGVTCNQLRGLPGGALPASSVRLQCGRRGCRACRCWSGFWPSWTGGAPAARPALGGRGGPASVRARLLGADHRCRPRPARAGADRTRRGRWRPAGARRRRRAPHLRIGADRERKYLIRGALGGMLPAIFT